MQEHDAEKMAAENKRLKQELTDQRILNENTIEHSTALENELVEQNTKLNALQNKMKKYLSPQLYNQLLGGKGETALVHTRKKLTVFFSDIVSFSEITDSIESELLSDVLNQYLNKMAEIATTWGGTIDKFIGDAVMVFFGDPEFIDDVTHAKNCVHMALEMLDELRKLRVHWQEMGLFHVLQIRVGINTGYCTVGNFGSIDRMDYTIVGGQVNIAARLEGIAEEDSIYLSHATYTLIQDEFDCSYVGNITVKGVHHPIEVYKLIGLRKQEVNIAPLIQKTKTGFSLKEIHFDSASGSINKREAVKMALYKALEIIDQAEKIEKQKQVEQSKPIQEQ
ncbi:MAG: adenylate/guanylate cyclase domain-containing protein [Spirochaetales bacterium]|nr:adenylate/guanylate cyclase domain-containing protein [Spirochaetales bacterium]